MAGEQTGTPVQDPVQPAAPAAPAEPVQQVQVPQVGPGPWQAQLQQSFDPQTAAQVDAFLRSNVQPHVTRLEQQYAETEAARQIVDALQRDPEAYNVQLQRELYGDQYADQFAAQLGRTDLVLGAQPAAQQWQQPQQQAQQVPQNAELAPEYRQALDAMVEQQRQAQYDEAKASFLSDPQYADINPDLFDPFVAGAETWEDAVNSYRSYAAQWAERTAPVAPLDAPPPTLGSGAGGAPGSTPAEPDYSQMRDPVGAVIDDLFAENKPIAPPVMGQ